MVTAAGTALALLLAGCGTDTPENSGGGTSSPTTAGPSSAAPNPGQSTTLNVSETEFTIKLSKSAVKPGDYVFAISNDGSFPHNLAIAGPGVDNKISDTFQGGNEGELAVTLQEGTYTLWCAVGTHRAQGMETTIKVTA